MKHIFIMNPMAGKTNVSEKLIPEIEKLKMEKTEIEYEVVLTEYPGHGRELAGMYAKKFAPKEETDTTTVRIYACGGDGTLNEVVAGANGYQHVEVGCLPYGTGNDYVKNFGTADQFQNLKNVVEGESIAVDFIDTNQGVAAEICTVGFDATVGYNTRHYKKLPFCHGKMAYNLAVVESLLHPIGTKLKITIDGEVLDGEYLLMCVANGTTYGGGFYCAPEANVCDGMLDIIIVNKISRFSIAKIIAKYSNGTYQDKCRVLPEFQKCIKYIRGKEIAVEGPKDFVINLDGECIVQKKIEMKVVEKSMKFILPKGMEYKKS